MGNESYLNFMIVNICKGEVMREKEATVVASRIPKKLRELMREYIQRDTHLNESDFIRAAIREKIERDAPRLLEGLFSKREDKPGG